MLGMGITRNNVLLSVIDHRGNVGEVIISNPKFPNIHAGDIVMYPNNFGTFVHVGDVRYVLVSCKEIFGKITDMETQLDALDLEIENNTDLDKSIEQACKNLFLIDNDLNILT